MLNLDIESEMAHAVKSLGFSIEDLYAEEDDYMLGNGSEGRTRRLPARMPLPRRDTPPWPTASRYDYGQFNQEIRNGVQIERPNDWMRRGNPWEILRLEYTCTVKFGGKCRLPEPCGPARPLRMEKQRDRSRDPVRHPDRRLPERDRQYASALVGPLVRGVPARLPEPRRLRARLRGQIEIRPHHPAPVSGRGCPARHGPAHEAAVFFHQRLAARTSSAGSSRTTIHRRILTRRSPFISGGAAARLPFRR